ncbi:TetR/AcrR family transcriptional regulator [Oscillatoria sp. CS-180]|uniref:TetR/AcrR family transcriptional regulator n=1 Tax=Oscillatoria sp. CS-180 TaxID=3021720 RepID=UPI00232F09EF|nr:TetR/AcrR family transcriptional regulator [Oscillatoria sp. CS-180]MDB9524791.1 TetR/AcrR family transcriptional regulator [Oscillatoria sp. CS-180]
MAAKQAKSSADTRVRLLCAASEVAINEGVEALTLSAVAQHAGTSKGGLLYHFPTKDALLTGMVEQLVQDFETALQTAFDQDDAPGTPGQWLRAYIRATLQFNKKSLALIICLSSVVTASPELLEAAKSYEQRWQLKLKDDGIDLTKASIIQLAVDGLWFSEVFHFGTPDEALLNQIIKTLINMAREPK